MSNQSPRTLESLFEAAVSLESADERSAFLDESCAGDTKLRRTVEALLRSHEQAGSFLQVPLCGDVDGSLKAGLARTFDKDEAMVIGNAGHSVLKQMGETIDLPRVVLRESLAERPDPIQRPKSPELPTQQNDSRYQLQGEIARGGMGAIIKGRDTDLGRDLAIKVLLEEHKAKPEVIQRFVEEAQIGGQLQHPGIAPVFELGQFSDQRPFFSMKLVKGQTLSKLLGARKHAAEDRGRFLGIFEQICQTMAYAHSRGVVHRDLKPANVMVGAFGEVQVMDWGLAKVLPAGGVADEKEARDTQMRTSIIQTLRSVGSNAPGTFGSVGSQTQMGSVMGTPAYMPPEQALGEIDNLDERSDVFGLGALLCEILTGEPPYVADDGKDVFRLASRGKLEDCIERLDECGADAELIALAKQCLELEPMDRPRDAGELAEQVSGYLESVETKLRDTEVERAAQTARAEEERKRRRVTLVSAASLILLVCLGGGGWLYKARQHAEVTKQNLYYANMLTAGHIATEKDGLSQVAQLTDAWMPGQNQPDDLRGWEWYYLKSQLLQAKESFPDRVGVWHGNRLRLIKMDVDDCSFSVQDADEFSVHDSDEGVLGGVPPNSVSKGCSVSTNVEQMTAAILHRNGLLVIWDLKTKLELHSLQAYDTPLSSSDSVDREVRVSLGPNSQRVATWRDGTLKIWDLSSSETTETRRWTDVVRPRWMAWSPDGSRLATTILGGRLQIWDPSTDEHQLSDLPSETKEAWAVVWSPDGERIAVGVSEGFAVLILDATTGAELKSLTGGVIGPSGCLAFSSDGRYLASGHSKAVYVWDTEKEEPEIVGMLRGHAARVKQVAWDAADARLITMGWADGTYWTDGPDSRTTTKVWDAGIETMPKDRLGRSSLLADAESEGRLFVGWSPDGKYFATSDGGTIEVRNSDTRQLHYYVDLKTALPNEFTPVPFAWSPDGEYFAFVDGDGAATVCESASGETVAPPFGRAIYGVADAYFFYKVALAWRPDGKRIALTTEEAIVIYDWSTGESMATLSNPVHSAWSIAWHPKGNWLASWDREEIHIWDTRTEQVLDSAPAQVYSADLAWRPDGNQLAASFGENVKIWDWDGQSLANPRELSGHSNAVVCVAWSPDGKRLLTGAQDATARIWDSATGQETLAFYDHKTAVFVYWHPDGERILTAEDGLSGWGKYIWDASKAYDAERQRLATAR